MKALSIRQPWAWAILYAGKTVENRNWSTRYPGYLDARWLSCSRKEFLIHASSGLTRAEYNDFYNDWHDPNGWMRHCSGRETCGGLPAFERLARGGIVGVARIAGIVTEYPSPWFFGPVGLVLDDVRPTKFVPCKGALGFFEVPDDVFLNLHTA